MLSYKHSLIGFHNPYLHKDLTPTEFLEKYIVSLLKKSKRKDGWRRIKLAKWIKENWDDQLKFVARMFPNTLKNDKKESSRSI